jgi:hypothetical protein
MRSPRKYLLVLTGLTLSAVVASLSAQGPGPYPVSGPGQVPPLATPTPPTSIAPTTMTITAPQADVFCGPAVNYYVTSRLNGGERVVVLGESTREPGWLAILPPRGSSSLIDARYVKTVPGVDGIGIVDTSDPKGSVRVCPASNVFNIDPNVESGRAVRGTQVVLLDRQRQLSNATWYPIAPLANEVRFIRAEDVRGGAYASNGYGGNPYQNSYGGNPYAPATPTGYVNSAYPAAAAPAAAAGFVAIAQQGDQALQAGNSTRAYQLYTEALGQTTDAQWQRYLRDQIARIAPPNPASNWTPPGGAPALPTSLTGAASTPAAAVPGQKQWSSWGVLRTTTFTHEGQPMYLLEGIDSATPLYIAQKPGTNLHDYVGQTVCLYGLIGYRDDQYIRMTYMTAEQVNLSPGAQHPGGAPALPLR